MAIISKFTYKKNNKILIIGLTYNFKLKINLTL